MPIRRRLILGGDVTRWRSDAVKGNQKSIATLVWLVVYGALTTDELLIGGSLVVLAGLVLYHRHKSKKVSPRPASQGSPNPTGRDAQGGSPSGVD